MSPGESRKTKPLRWYLLLIGIAAVTLGAFWVLLGQRYSPETFIPVPVAPDTIEFGLFGGALIAVVVALVALTRWPETWRSRVSSAIPLALVALLVSAKALLGAPIRTYDMLLFTVAGGWSVRLWLRTKETPASESFSSALRFGVGSAVVLLAAWQFWQQVRYFNDLALGYADCGENARLMFNTMTNPRELLLRVNPNKPLFYDHFYPGILPFVPLWLLWPDLKLTIALQLVAVFGVVVPLYLIGKRVFRDQASALLLVLAWLLYPSTSQFIFSSSYGFRWGNMCLLLYFLALACWVNGRAGWALAMAVWAMLIKEEAAILVGTFGVYLAVFERRRTAGIALAAFGFGFFLLATSVLIPALSGEHYAMTRFFYSLGHTNWEILMSPLTKPRVFWGKLFEPSSFYFAAALLAPLLLLPARKPSVLFIGAPTFVFCCMNPVLKNICFHYQAVLLPVIFWAFVRAVEDGDARRRHNALMSVATCGAIFSIFLGAQPWSKETVVVHRWPGRLALVHRLVGPIDQRDTLFATQRVAAHFVTQRYLYLDPPVPQGTDCALLDLRDSWRGLTESLDWLRRLRNFQHEVEAIPGLRLVGAADGLLFYSRRGAPLDAQPLVERNQLPEQTNRTSVDLGGVRVAGFTLTALPREGRAPSGQVRVTTFSTIPARTNLDLAVRCIIHVGSDLATAEMYASEFQPLGQGIWATARWETNKFYADDFLVELPAGLAEDVLTVSFLAVPLSPVEAGTAASKNF